MNHGLVVRGLTYAVGRRTLLQDVSLQLRAGELTLLIGPNGAGKSTLIHLLSGALVPTRGSIEIDGRDIRGFGAESLARLRSLVSQAQPTPFPFPVSEVVALGRACSRPREAFSETRRHVLHALFITGSSHLERRDFSTLSGGERQKVVSARALAQLSGAAEPTWLLLDEPTSGLDVKEQDRLFETARNFAACGNGVLAIAHDWSLAARHADRIVVLESGRVRAIGRPELVFSSGAVDGVFGVVTRIVDSCHGSESPLVPVVMDGSGIARVNQQVQKVKRRLKTERPHTKEESVKGSYRVGHDSTTSEVALLESWERWKADNPGGRSRDAAHALGVSECALVAAQCGDASIRLDGQWEALLRGLEPVGPLMGLTRNEACVIECEGVYERPHFHGSMGQFTGSRIDLRIFLRNWHHGFATRVATARGEIESLQFFDSDGVAVHKIYLREESDDSRWKSLIERHTASDQTPRLDGMTPDPFATRMGSIPNASANGESDSSGTWADDGVEAASRSLSDERAVRDVESSSSRTELDSAAFLSEWEGMKDTHEFVPLLRRHGLTRRDALELARGRFSREVVLDAALATFAELSRQERKCMVFVANHGCLQIHSGPIRRVVETPGWLNVMDPGFNLHLHRAQATAAYVVRKPTESGTVTSLEIFGADPEPLALLFSYRKGGEEEERGWVDLLAGIPNS